jgi:hypothetical protein
MKDSVVDLVTVHIPADLAAKLQEMKQDREDDRNKSLEELVQEMCRSYVEVRELARIERDMHEELERSYRDRPSDFDDADEWAANPQREEGKNP